MKAWFKKWWKWILAAAGVLFAILTAGIIVRQVRSLGKVKDQLAIAEATKEIEKLRAVRQEIAARVGEKDEAIEVVDEKLAANRRQIIEAHENGQGMSDEEVDAAFAALGY